MKEGNDWRVVRESRGREEKEWETKKEIRKEVVEEERSE